MLANATITYNISDLGLVDFDYRRTKVWASTNIVGGAVIDTAGDQIRLGTAKGTLAADGTGSITVPVPGTGSNPVSWQTTIHVDYPNGRERCVRHFGPFTITASGDLADLVPQQEIPAEYLTTVTTQLGTYVTSAAASAAAAAASAATASAIGNLTGEDEAVALLMNDSASDTSIALAGAITNPETAQNAAVLEVVEGVLGGGVSGLMQTIDARGLPTTARPASGRVLWLVNDGETTPTYATAGDVVMQVGVTQLPWTPAQGVPGMVGWFDAQSLTSLADTAVVASWPNLAPSGSPFVQATSGAQPVMSVAKINGKRAVVADGVNDRMTFDNPDYTGPVTIYIVAGTDLADVTGTSDFLIGAKNSVSPTLRMDLYRDTAEGYNLARNSILASAAAAWTVGPKRIKLVGNSTTSSITVAGTSVASGTTGTISEVTEYTLFSRSDSANFWPGYVGELIIVHGTVDTPTDAKINAYLTSRWGVA